MKEDLRAALIGCIRKLLLGLRRVGIIAYYSPFMADRSRELEIRSTFKVWKETSWFRVPMYNAIYDTLKSILPADCSGKKAIEIGAWGESTLQRILESFGISYERAPQYPEVDIHKLPYSDKTYHFVVCDQVLEHVKKPWVAVEEIRRVLKPRGIAIVTSPFLLAYHADGKYLDYWRFTPDAWPVLFERFEIIEAGGWGNADAVRAGWRYSDVGFSGASTPMEEALVYKLWEKSDRINYLTTWCIARRPDRD